MRYAAIDIGTVTTRMLVAEVSGSQLVELDKQYRITNLGEGVDATGTLKASAIQRVVDAVSDYLRIRDTFATSIEPHIPTIVVATSASRDASNAAEFAAHMAAIQAPVEVIPGVQEAALSFLGATAALGGKPAIVVDIGGGSTEVIAGIGGEEPQFVHSFDIGCRRVTERFLAGDPPLPDELDRAAEWVRREMAPVLAGIDDDIREEATVIAVAGTATSVVSIRERMEVYDSERVHGSFVSLDDCERVYRQLAQVALAERKTTIGLDPGRADVIVAGVLILRTVLELLGKEGYTASESDILHGLIWKLASRGTIT